MSLRILYDARSSRTPAGRYVMRGLTNGWLSDGRVEEVLVVVPPGSNGGDVPAGVTLVRSGTRSWFAYLARELGALATRRRADVIFSPNATPPRDSRAVLYFQDLKHVRTTQHHLLGARQRMGEALRSAWRRLVAPSCAFAACVSEDIAREVRSALPLPVVMIPNGVDVDGVRWTGQRDVVVVMGGIGPWKGEETALRAWASVAGGMRGATRLEILGVEPPDRRKSLEAMARVLGVDTSIAIRGMISREEFLREIATARLAVSCSRFEAFGLPVAEALVMGAPVLCSDLPAHAELVRRAGAGEVVPVDDSPALAAAIARVLAGREPPRLTSPPPGWQWADRARQHVDAFVEHLSNVRH